MSTFYVGNSGDLAVTQLGNSRFLYAVRRNDDGELFLVKVDQLVGQDSFELNTPGDPENNYVDFEEGIDFLDGVDQDHEPVYENMKYTQYKWDGKSAFYFVDEQGQLVVRINREYVYPDGTSS
jgi:hypothetical protein